MQELKAKRAEMARLRIQLQQAENRNIKLAQEAAERKRKRRDAEDFEAMKLRVLQLERLVADKAVVDPAAVRRLLRPHRLACPAGNSLVDREPAAVQRLICPHRVTCLKGGCWKLSRCP